MKLHIGGKIRRDGWTILDAQPAPYVDLVGTCVDLSMIESGTVSEVYASHVLEHLGYVRELPQALREIFRVLVPGGMFKVSVPDINILCMQMATGDLDIKGRFQVMRMMFGGQTDEHDFHKVGLTDEFLASFLTTAGFVEIRRVQDLGLFDDTSRMQLRGVMISLNMIAVKPARN